MYRTAALALALCLLPASSSPAQGAPSYDPRAAHRETDLNGDGKVDREEFHRRMVEIFFHADSDKSGTISWEELEAAVLFPEDYRAADTDGDGRVSLPEFVKIGFDDFDEIDGDSDGMLSVQEVVVVFERGGVR